MSETLAIARDGRLATLVVLLSVGFAPVMAAQAMAAAPVLKRFTIAPKTDDVFDCPEGRQIYSVEARIERQSIPIILLGVDGKEIPEGVFASARGFRLDRAHEHPVAIIMTCGP